MKVINGPIYAYAGIYAIRFRNKSYYGCVVDLSSTKAKHLRKLKRGTHHISSMQSDFNEHPDEFIFEVIRRVDRSQLDSYKRETNKLAYEDPFSYCKRKRINCFNLEGELVNVFYSTHEAAKHLQTKAGILSSYCNTGNIYKGLYRFSYSDMPEPLRDKSKVVGMYDDNGLVATYTSIREAFIQTGIRIGTLRKALDTEETVGGYTWKWYRGD